MNVDREFLVAMRWASIRVARSVCHGLLDSLVRCSCPILVALPLRNFCCIIIGNVLELIWILLVSGKRVPLSSFEQVANLPESSREP